MTHLVLMRHGRSLLNDGYKSSEADNVLTWRGALATLSESEPLKDLGIHRVFTSTIPRAYQTAMLAVGAIGYGIPITQHPEIEEIRSRPEIHHLPTQYDQGDAKSWKKDIDHRPSWGTESQREVYARATGFLEATLPDALEQGSVLVVSHYFTLRAIQAWIEHDDAARIPSYRPRNSAPLVYRAEDVLGRISGARDAEVIERIRL